MRYIFVILLLTLQVYAAPFIHPDMEEAIRVNEQTQEASEFEIINGIKCFTGFRPTRDFYAKATYLDYKVDPNLVLPKSFDMRLFSYSPVRGQVQGSCWAEGNVSAFELTWNAVLGTKQVFSVDDVIHCSGYGSARRGGQLSMAYNTKSGLALEADYPYTGKDARCKRDIDRHLPLKAAPFLRGAEGDFPTERELMAAAYEYGAFEVCGSAQALGDGGRQDTIRRGRTNHCYAYAGWLDGDQMGWLPGVKYHLIKNSWGDCDKSNPLSNGRCWGDKGWGYYRLSKDGVEISGSVITEIQVADTGKPLRPAVPTQFVVESEVATLTVVIGLEANYDEARVREVLMAALDEISPEPEKSTVVLAVFGAPWCGPCKKLIPQVDAELGPLVGIDFRLYVTTGNTPSEPATEEVASSYRDQLKIRATPYADRGWKYFREIVGSNLTVPSGAVLAPDGKILFRSTGIDPKELVARARLATSRK